MVDLHIHSNLSLYGKMSLEDILKLAEKKHISKISITDYNTALGHVWLESINAKRYFSGEILSGAEVDVCENGIVFQVLVYGFDVDPIAMWLKNKYGTRVSRQTEIRNKLYKLAKKNGFIVDESFYWDPDKEFAHQNFYRMLIKNTKNIEKFGRLVPKDGTDFFNISTNVTDFPLYLDMSKNWPSLEEVGNIIHKHGGKVFLANPYFYRRGKKCDDLLEMTKGKIDGIEVYRTGATKQQIDFLLDYCKKYNLKISGGSGAQNRKFCFKFAKIPENLVTI